jgi:hypothetical protein
VQYVRVYDASRQPRDWMDLIRPGQFVVFPSLVEGGEPCGFDGAPQDHHLAVCAIADSLTEAEQACRDLVAGHPTVRFDVFDSAGRSHPPLLTIVHPDRAPQLEGNASVRRRNTRIAIALIVAAPLLMWLDWTASGLMIVPTVVAVNGLLLAARLLQLNAAYGANERRQRERLASLEAESSRRE